MKILLQIPVICILIMMSFPPPDNWPLILRTDKGIKDIQKQVYELNNKVDKIIMFFDLDADEEIENE